MPRVRLKIPAWLIQDGQSSSAGFHESHVLAVDLADLIEEIRSAARGCRTLQDILQDRTFGLILNGRYANPNDPSEAELKEGDEVVLIPLMDGG